MKNILFKYPKSVKNIIGYQINQFIKFNESNVDVCHFLKKNDLFNFFL